MLLAACGTLKGYPGESLPADQVALVKWGGWPGGLRVKALDGELPGASSSAEVLPGEHIVNFTHSSNLGLTTYSATLTFEVEAGRIYRLRARCGSLVECQPFWAWIEDVGSATVIAGRNPQ